LQAFREWISVQAQTAAGELITVHYNDSVENRLRSVELPAQATLAPT
jgi:hypothetical protein